MRQAEFKQRLDEMQGVAPWVMEFTEGLNESRGDSRKADVWRKEYLDDLLPLLGGATLKTPDVAKGSACFMASWASGVLLTEVLGKAGFKERAEAHRGLTVVTDRDTAEASRNAAEASRNAAEASRNAAEASRNAADASRNVATILGWEEVGRLAVPAVAGIAVLSSPEGDTRDEALGIVRKNDEVYRHLAPHLG